MVEVSVSRVFSVKLLIRLVCETWNVRSSNVDQESAIAPWPQIGPLIMARGKRDVVEPSWVLPTWTVRNSGSYWKCSWVVRSEAIDAGLIGDWASNSPNAPPPPSARALNWPVG